MDPTRPPEPLHRYRVRLGHAEVQVEGHSPHEAIQLARRRLCQELPRLWDVIQTAEESRFQVAVEEQ